MTGRAEGYIRGTCTKDSEYGSGRSKRQEIRGKAPIEQEEVSVPVAYRTRSTDSDSLFLPVCLQLSQKAAVPLQIRSINSEQLSRKPEP